MVGLEGKGNSQTSQWVDNGIISQARECGRWGQKSTFGYVEGVTWDNHIEISNIQWGM